MRFSIATASFLFLALIVFIAIEFLDNPVQIIDRSSEIIADGLPLFSIVFLPPSIFFGTIVSLTLKSLKLVSVGLMVLYSVGYFLLIDSTMFNGDDGEFGLMILYGISGFAFLIASILGIILRKIIGK